MTRRELLDTLRRCALNPDYERAHLQADCALVAYVDDDEVAEAYVSVRREYA